ncbi:MAG TPA: hypothetical protein VEA81_05010 [Burkholderiaceae bacterium]|nr:hypothetical protein [Burkholderiaceae bacterium]
MKSIQLPPGSYRVELRNPAAPPAVLRIEVQAGRPVTLNHRIQESAR